MTKTKKESVAAEIESIETIRELRRTAPMTLVWVMEQTSKCVGEVLKRLNETKEKDSVKLV